MVKLGHFQYIQDGSGASGLGIHAAHDDFGDPGLHDGTGSHLAGLQCHIEVHSSKRQSPMTLLALLIAVISACASVFLSVLRRL